VNTIKNIIFRLLLVALGFAGIFAIIEITLRITRPISNSDPMGDRSILFFTAEDQRAHPWSHESPVVLRIAIIGDSFTAGVGVQEDDRYADRLERLLNMRAGSPPVEVRIYAQCGTSTFQQIALLDEALMWKPRIVILGICLNDMEDWNKPGELMRWRQSLLPLTWKGHVVRCSRAVNWIYTKIQQAMDRHWDLRYYQKLYKPSYSGVRLFHESIGIMNTKCREANVEFVPMIFPLLSEKFQEGSYPFEYAHDAIHAHCRAFNIRYLDLLRAFRNVSPEQVQVINHYDPHPNEIAHRIASETMLRHLIKWGLIPLSYHPKLKMSQTTQRDIWRQNIEGMQNSGQSN
jgi:hypothetical protein